MSTVVSLTGASTPATVIAQSSSWRKAVVDLVTWLVANDRAFSSGEVVAYLRTYRPDLKFSATGVGEYVRKWYEDNFDPNDKDAAPQPFPSYDDAGSPLYPTQVPRTTTGIARTLDGRKVLSKSPTGITVFVYAKDGVDGYAHDFEVYIPDGGDPTCTKAVDATQAQQAAVPAPVATAAPALSSTQSRFMGIGQTAIPVPPTPIVITGTGNLKGDDLKAQVYLDQRVVVPRAAFEAFVAASGRPIRGGPAGDPVHVTFLQTAAGTPAIEITRDATPTSSEFHLWITRGRIAIHAAPGFGPFAQGDKYEITVDATKLTIDLSKKV